MISKIKNIFELLVNVYDPATNSLKIFDIGSSGGVFEKGTASLTSVNYYDVVFSTTHNNYVPYCAINDNINVWFSNMTNSGFRINFSANYTGTIYYCILK